MVSQRESSETGKTSSNWQAETPGGNGATDESQSLFGQGAGKVKTMADQAVSQAQEIAGQASEKAREMAGRAFDQAQERAPEVMGQAPHQILDTSTGFFHRLEMMSPENYYYAAVGALGATGLLMLFGRRSLASFVGLWTALLLNLGLFSRILRSMERSQNSDYQG